MTMQKPFGLILLICVLFSANATASTGKVILAKGVVTATGADKASRVLAKNSPVKVGDIVNTATKSFAVIKMIDNTKLTLKPNTTVVLGEFNMKEGKEEACINLVKGGLRTVTGLIGERKPDSFHVDTPVASIGIRGTDFIVRICAEGECDDESTETSLGEFGDPSTNDQAAKQAIANSLPKGIYSSCSTGTVVMSQCAGQAESFEIGSCRQTQSADCLDVVLDAGEAGYASEPESEGSNTSAVDTGSGGAEGVASIVTGDATSASEAGSNDVASGSTSVDAGDGSTQNVVRLDEVPSAVSTEDAHFSLSDLSEGELDNIDQFTETLSSGGSCVM
ncbi:MAG: FecR family protein [Pseudomonadota bacterium]